MTLLRSPGDPWVRLAAGVWFLLALMSVGRAALTHHPRHAGCYSVYAQAGRDWLAGRDLYDSDHLDSLVVFRYSPPVGALLAPLGVVPDVVGNGLLRLANLVVFAAGLWLWQQVTLPGTSTPRLRAVFFLLVALVGNNSLMDVQVNVLTTGLLLLTAAGAITCRWWVAAVSIGLAVTLKAYPVSLALVLCLLAPRRFAWRWAVAQAGWLALPFALQTPGYVARQYREWFQYGLNQRFADGWFRDAMYLAGQVGWPMTRAAFNRLELVAAGVVAVLSWVHSRRGAWPAAVNTAFSLCVGWMLVFGPASESVTYFLAAPVVAGGVVPAWSRPGPVWYRAVLGAAVILLAGTQLELLFPGPHRFQAAGAHPAGMLLFLIAVGGRGFGTDSGHGEPARPLESPTAVAPAPAPDSANEREGVGSGDFSVPAAPAESGPGS